MCLVRCSGTCKAAPEHLAPFFSCWQAGSQRKRFLEEAPPSAEAFLGVSVLPPAANAAAQPADTGSRRLHTRPFHPSWLPAQTSSLWPWVLVCHNCKQLVGSVPKSRLSRCWKCVAHSTIFTNSLKQYNLATQSFTGWVWQNPLPQVTKCQKNTSEGLKTMP